MNLLSTQSIRRMDVYFKFVGQFTNYKQLSYLSFYINQKGDKIKYDPNLPLGALYKNPQKDSKYSLQEYMETINETYLYNQSLLTGLFHNQIMSLQQTQQILKNCVDLNLLSKKDITNFMFGNRITTDTKDWIQKFKQGDLNHFNLKFESQEGKLPDQKRKNFFVVIDQKIKSFSQLEQLIYQNYFFQIPNVNKILCLDMQVENINRFNDDLLKKETFFKEKNVKIKNLSSDKAPEMFAKQPLSLGYRIHKLLEQICTNHRYISKSVKGNTLIHQLPEYYQFHSEASIPQNPIIPDLLRFEPIQTFVFTQRIEDLSQSCKNYPFQFRQFTKSFTNRFLKDPYFTQFANGLLISRYLSSQSKKKNIKLIKMQEKGKLHFFDE